MDRGGMLLVWLAHSGLSASFLIQAKVRCPGVAPHPVAWAFLCQLVIKTVLHSYAMGQFDGENALFEVPSSQVTLACVMLK